MWTPGLSYALRRYPEKSFFILNLESVQLCPSAVLPHAISAQNCAEFEVKHKSNSSWTHSNPGTWKLVLILKWKTDWLVANISPTRTQLKSGTVCTVLLGTQFYAFQIQKSFLILDLECINTVYTPRIHEDNIIIRGPGIHTHNAGPSGRQSLKPGCPRLRPRAALHVHRICAVH